MTGLREAFGVGLSLAALTAPSARAGDPQVCDAGESPDIIVGDIQEAARWGQVDGITAYSFGRYACNSGTCWVSWFQNTNQHPVVGYNMYRLKSVDGASRLEQIGMSWLKHEYFALSALLCFADCQSTDGTHLGVHCADASSASLMGQQSNLGPRSQVNPATGEFPYPWTAPPPPPTIGRRCQVHNVDLDPALNPGALYFAEVQFIAPDDALAGNGNNNASYRRINVGSAPAFNIALAGTTQRERAGIRAWKEHGLGVGIPDPNVQEQDIHVPGDGLFMLAAKATDLGTGFWHYEYAVQNLNSHRSARSFSVPFPLGTQVQNAGFHDVDYHSGEPYDLTDWTISLSVNTITWSTHSFDQNENANALRWGTLYNFRFDADVAPVQSTVILGLFRPRSPTEVSATVIAPPPGSPDCKTNGIDDASDLASGTSRDCDTDGVPDECQLAGNDCNADGTPDPCQFAGSDCNSNGTLDDCELDCNSNGTADDCELAAGSAADCDADGVPDECELDCNHDGAPDPCEPGTLVFADDFETDQGWTVENVEPVAGIWERADPQQTVYNSVVVQPEFDSPLGTGTLCYVTDGRGPITSSYDVDYGPTRLTSPTLDLSGGPATLRYAYWFHTVLGQPDDMVVEVSNDDGATWVPIRSHEPSAGAWRAQRLVLEHFIVRTDRMRFRFSVSDPDNDSFTEGLVDDVVVTTHGCPAAPTASIVSAVSRHGCDLALIPGVVSEPRQLGVSEVRISFDIPPGAPGPGSIAVEQATCSTPVFAPYSGASLPAASRFGNDVAITFQPALENAATYRIALGPPITSIGGQHVELRALIGDVNGDGLANATDRSVVVGVWTGSGFDCRTDLDGDGLTNALDRSIVVGAWTGPQNCAP